jgi:hypothetical protein
MDRFVKESIAIKLHPDSINRDKGIKMSQTWNPSSSLLRYPITRTSRKSQEDNKEQTNKTDSWTLVHQRTIPTEGLPLVGEVSTNFRG